ncbi:MAG: tetratricopeptide repeat protein [Albidovulum sp.]|nr:tetratricopeptide repeat protein [Albidovulum sp.]
MPRRGKRTKSAPKGYNEESPAATDSVDRVLSQFSKWSPSSALALFAMVFASFYPVVNAGLVWDDNLFIAGPVKEWRGLWDIWFNPSTLREKHYWPLTYSTFWLEHKIWGLDPVGFHIVNLLLHAANTLILFRIMLRLSIPGSWFIAAIFAVHPLHVESVAWVIQRKDVLSGLFFLLSASAWIDFTDSGRVARHRLSVAYYGLGLLSKSVVVTLPASLMIMQWWRKGRIEPSDIQGVVPYFVLALVLVGADQVLYHSRANAEFDYSIIERLLIASQSVWFYLGKIAFPADLAVIYPKMDFGLANPLAWLALLGGLAMLAAAWAFRSRIGRGAFAGYLFFVITLSPTLGFVDYGYMKYSFVADRFQYLAGIGIIAASVGAAAAWISKLPLHPKLGNIAAALAICAALGALTWQRTGIYRDDIAFYGSILVKNPNLEAMNFNYANALVRAERYDEAIGWYYRTLELNPASSDAMNNLGIALLESRKYEEAVKHFRKSLEVYPTQIGLLNNLGIAHLAQGDIEAAEQVLDFALGIDPSSEILHSRLIPMISEAKNNR